MLLPLQYRAGFVLLVLAISGFVMVQALFCGCGFDSGPPSFEPPASVGLAKYEHEKNRFVQAFESTEVFRKHREARPDKLPEYSVNFGVISLRWVASGTIPTLIGNLQFERPLSDLEFETLVKSAQKVCEKLHLESSVVLHRDVENTRAPRSCAVIEAQGSSVRWER